MDRTYILATDGSPQSRDAEEFAAEILRPESDHIIVFGAVQGLPVRIQNKLNAGDVELDELESSLSQEIEQMLTDTVSRLEDRGFDARYELEFGDPGEQVTELASEVDADGIFIGKTGQSKIGEFLLGSVSQYIIHHSQCPVTVTPSSYTD